MEPSAITDSYIRNSKYTHANVADEAHAPQTPTAQNSPQNTTLPKGDMLTISPNAREAAAQAARTSTPPAQAPLSYTTVKKTITTDGTEVLIEAGYGKDADGKRQLTEARVTFTGKDGTTSSHNLTESAVFTQDENGQWQIHQAEGRSITGTEKDDVIVAMPKAGGPKGLAPSGVVLAPFNENTTTDSIDAGEGNNIIVDFSGEATNIHAGSGNDTIVGLSNTGRYVINSGAGDDVIELSGYDAMVKSGEGNDNITLKTIYTGDVSGGEGNDSIIVKGRNGHVAYSNYLGYRPTIDGGDGDDTITTGAGKVLITGGNGNDNIVIKNGAGIMFDIKGGDGKDTISVDFSGGSANIYGENDDDKILMHDSSGTITVHGGNGNDEIRYTEIHGGTQRIYGDEGNDYISTGNITGGSTHIDGGSGNDTIGAGDISGGNTYITGGSGNDVIRTGILGGTTTIDGGSGDDTISATYMTTRSKIIGGQGKDRIFAEIPEWLDTNEIQANIYADAEDTIAVAKKVAASKSTRAQANKISEYEQQVAEAAMGIAPQKSDTMAANDAPKSDQAIAHQNITTFTDEAVSPFVRATLRPLASLLGDQGTSALPARGLEENIAHTLREIRLSGAMSNPNYIEQSLQEAVEATGWLTQKALHRYGQQTSL